MTAVTATARSPWRFLNLTWLPLAWMLQYTLVVPTVWLWRYLVVPATKIGGVAVLLLFIPVIGWIVLAVMLLRRPAPPERRKSNDYLRPWGRSLL